MCYSSVCSAARSRDPKSCNTGARGAQVAVGANAGTNNDITAELVGQATPSYHCHLTLADDSACDYVQWDQHEESRDYYMQYGVLCGWENVRCAPPPPHPTRCRPSQSHPVPSSRAQSAAPRRAVALPL